MHLLHDNDIVVDEGSILKMSPKTDLITPRLAWVVKCYRGMDDVLFGDHL